MSMAGQPTAHLTRTPGDVYVGAGDVYVSPYAAAYTTAVAADELVGISRRNRELCGALLFFARRRFLSSAHQPPKETSRLQSLSGQTHRQG